MTTVDWHKVPGEANDVGVGSDGSVWCIGTTPIGDAADRGIYHWNGSDWDPPTGGGIEVSVGPELLVRVASEAHEMGEADFGDRLIQLVERRGAYR